MKISDIKPTQQSLFSGPATKSRRIKFISTYRVALVKDQDLPFAQCRLANSQQAQPIIRKLIETHGQSDREQFCVLLLNTKNEVVGLNIVSTGAVMSTSDSTGKDVKIGSFHYGKVRRSFWLHGSSALICSQKNLSSLIAMVGH